jgi:hypothetical protein
VPTPKKSSRRRGGDDTRRHFNRAANKTTRRRTRQAAISAMLWLADTLDWLDLWHPAAESGSELTGDTSGPNHLSPRL